MTIQVQHTRFPWMSLPLIAATALVGCNMHRTSPTAAYTPPSEPVVSPAPTASPASTQEQRLAQIDAFLDRTRAYQATEPQDTPRTPPPPIEEILRNRAAQQDRQAPVSMASRIVDDSEAVAYQPATVQVNRQATLADINPVAPKQSAPVLLAVSIESSSPTTPVAELPKSEQVTANTPLDVRAVRTELTDDWLAMLQERAAKSPGLDSEWALRLAQLAVGRDLDAEKISSELPADLRRLMLSFVNLAGTVRRIAQNPQYVDERALDRVEDLRAILLEHAEPKVSSIALCRKVVGYGVFDSLPEEELLAGRAFRMLVYCEIDRLRAEETPEGMYRTQLSTRLELLTAGGTLVWEYEEPQIEDVCRKHRRDFFLTLPVSLPATLAAGDYALKVHVEDKLANLTGGSTLLFTLQSPVSLANRS